jgi:aminoglycoside N3'-acetyltransferase
MTVVTRAQVFQALEELEIRPGDHLLIHSALLPLGRPADGTHTYLAPLLDTVGPEGTLVAPTFTFGFIQTGQYDVVHTPSVGMGALAEAIRRHPDACRTPHPLQSLSAIGGMARHLAACRTLSAYSEGSAFDVLARSEAKILLLGAEPRHISHTHLSEERVRVPYRFDKHVPGTARLATDESPESGTWNFYARYLEVPIILAREHETVETLLAGKVWKDTLLNGVRIYAGSCRAYCELTDDLLNRDPFGLLSDPDAVKTFCKGMRDEAIHAGRG